MKWGTRIALIMSQPGMQLMDLCKESIDKRWTERPSDTLIQHVRLHVSHLSNAMNFYHQILGFGLTATYPDEYFLLREDTITTILSSYSWSTL